MSFNPNGPLEPGEWVVPPADLPPGPGIYGQPAYDQPFYGQPQYGQYATPYQPQYLPAYPAPGYSQYPIPGGQWPGGPQRPGQIMAASILGYITAGLLILAGLLLLIGATAVNDISNSLDGDDHGLTAEFIFDGLGNLVAAGLLIAGGSMLTIGNWRGRIWIAFGTAIVAAFSIYWIIRTQWSGVIVWGLIFTAMPVIAVCLAFSRAVTDWLARQPQR